MPRLRCLPLVGRDAEMGAAREALAEARRGRGTSLAVLGEPGIGKSRLVREITESAGPDMPTLVGRAVADGPADPFRPLAEALLSGVRTAPAVLATLGSFQPVLARLLGSPGTATPTADGSPTALAEGVLRLLRELAGGQGLVLALEDLHWSDPETLFVVEYLADNLARSPLVLVLTARDEHAPARTMIRRLAERSAATLVELTPLGDDAVRAMADACLGGPPDTRLLAHLLARAAGVPLLVEELLGAGSRAVEDAFVPASVAELTRFRLGALEVAARVCVRVAALLGTRFDSDLLPAATGLDVDSVAAGLRAALDLSLLDAEPDGEVRFRHALTRDAVLDTILPPERTELARRALRAVEVVHPQLDGEWCGIAARLAATAGDLPRASELLLAAGRRDLSCGALSTAEATLRSACDLASGTSCAADVDEALAEVLVQAGQPQGAADVTARLVRSLRAGDQPRRLAAAHIALARAWTVAGEWEAAGVQTGRARLLVQAGSELTVRADLVDGQVACGRGDFDDAERLVRTVLATVADAGPPEVTCEALELHGRLLRRHDLAAAQAAFERQRRTAETHDLPLWSLRALHELATVEALDGLRLDPLYEARDAAARSGALAVATNIDLHLAGATLARDEIDVSLTASRRCAEDARRLRLPAVPMATALQAIALAVRDDWPAAELLAESVLRDAPDDPVASAEAWHAHAIHWLYVEDLPRARAALERAVEMLRRAGSATSLPALGRWALLATVQGDEGVPDKLATFPGVGVARWTRGFLGYAEAVRHGRAGRPDDAEAAFLAADRLMIRPVALPGFRHHSCRLVAEAALESGWGRPVEWLRAALGYFEESRVEPVAAACRRLLRDAGEPIPRHTPGPAVPSGLRGRGVTAREMEVLLLLRDGLTNRDIAARLVLSPRTVEKHVERLLAKSGAGGRAQLAVWAGDRA